jgi:hypothetical protein
MRNWRSVLVALFAAVGIAFGIMVAGPSGTARADTGACSSFLEHIGEDGTVRYQLCALTETLGDVVSQEYAQNVCVTLMHATGLANEWAYQACTLAVAP